MRLLEERIQTDGIVREGNVLKVDSFLNHQMDIKLFREIGCATCHRPSWTTGDDNYPDPNGYFKDGDSRLPRYPHQTIWPYSDMFNTAWK